MAATFEFTTLLLRSERIHLQTKHAYSCPVALFICHEMLTGFRASALRSRNNMILVQSPFMQIDGPSGYKTCNIGATDNISRQKKCVKKLQMCHIDHTQTIGKYDK